MIDALFRTNLETVSANTKNQFPKYAQNSLDDTHDGAFVFVKAVGLQAGKRLNFLKPFRTPLLEIVILEFTKCIYLQLGKRSCRSKKL